MTANGIKCFLLKKIQGLPPLANGRFIGDGSGLTDLDRTKLSGVDEEGDANTFLNAAGAFSGITGIKVNEATAADTAKALKKDLIGSDSNEWTVTANGIKMFSVKKDTGLTLANGRFIGDGSGLTDPDRTKLSGVDTEEVTLIHLNATGAFSGITGIKVNEATAADTAKALKRQQQPYWEDSNEWTVTANGIKMFLLKKIQGLPLLMVDSLEMVLV